MCPLPYDPNWKRQEAEPLATDLESLHALPEALPGGAAALEPTDFQTLKAATFTAPERTPPRTWTDLLIDSLTPLLILLLVYSVIFFLLDVRYVYTAKHDANLRVVAFFFILGVVALNRLIARDGSHESVIYMIGLAGAIGMYTFSTTSWYEVGAVSRNFMNDSPYLATAFNMMIVAFIWWLVNRLTHECCVDENKAAGDIGILTGTVRRWQAAALARQSAPAPKAPKKKAPPPEMMPFQVIEPYDPLEGYKPKTKPTETKPPIDARLPARHPGVSIFLVSIPVMFIFAMGLRVVQHGGPSWIKAGAFYMGVYTVCALALLMLTSLGGLREFFRARRIAMPEGIGWFWIGLGLVQIAIVLSAAAQLPKPDLPEIAYVDAHERDPWNRGDRFELAPVSATPLRILEQSRFLDRVGQGALAALAIFAAFAALKGASAAAGRLLRRREHLPLPLVRVLDAADRAVLALTRLPRPAARPKRIRIQRDVAACARFSTSLGDPARPARMNTRDHISHAYDALCAIAQDLGVPRNLGQTPYEFLAAFPDELDALREEAEELTRLYVMAAYSPEPLDEKLEDRLRKFWITYGRVRARVVK